MQRMQAALELYRSSALRALGRGSETTLKGSLVNGFAFGQCWTSVSSVQETALNGTNPA